MKILAVTRSGRDGTLPRRADRRDLGPGGPLRRLRARHRGHAPSDRRPGAVGDEVALLDRQHRPRVADRHRGARPGARSGIIGGAALDVTDPEPLPDGHPLWASPHVLITPHVANPPSAMARDLAKRVQENVRRFAAGEELLAPVNLDAGLLTGSAVDTNRTAC